MRETIQYSQYELLALASWVLSLNPDQTCPSEDRLPWQLRRLESRQGEWYGAGFIRSVAGTMTPVTCKVSISSALGGWVYHLTEELFIDNCLQEVRKTMISWDSPRQQLAAVEHQEHGDLVVKRHGVWRESTIQLNRPEAEQFGVIHNYQFDSDSSLVIYKLQPSFADETSSLISRIKFHRS